MVSAEGQVAIAIQPQHRAYVQGQPPQHVALTEWADALLIAPLSANSLAKVSSGLCDNIVTRTARAWPLTPPAKPFVVAPAMNTKMWDHAVTAAQMKTLESWGVLVAAPIAKLLACGDLGVGAMAAVPDIVSCLVAACGAAAAENGHHCAASCGAAAAENGRH